MSLKCLNTLYKPVNVEQSKVNFTKTKYMLLAFLKVEPAWFCSNKLLINFIKTKYMLFNDYNKTNANLHIKKVNAIFKDLGEILIPLLSILLILNKFCLILIIVGLKVLMVSPAFS